MVAVPADTPVTKPVLFTLATPALEDDQTPILLCESCVVLFTQTEVDVVLEISGPYTQLEVLPERPKPFKVPLNAFEVLSVNEVIPVLDEDAVPALKL
jgi:hypothetical protein